MNKKGFIGLGVAIVAGVVILLLALGIGIFTALNWYTIIGAGLIVLTIIYVIPAAIQGNVDRNKIIVILILVGVGLFIFFIPKMGILQQTMFTMSISDVEVKDDGGKILIYATQGGGQQLELTISPTKINQFIDDDGYRIKNTMILSAKFVGSDMKFNFYTDNEHIDYVKLLKETRISNYLGSCKDECIQQGYDNTVAIYDPSFDNDCYCIETFDNGYVTYFTGGESGGFEIEFDLDGDKQILKDDSQYIELKGGLAKIRWVGNLLGINSVGTPNSHVYHVNNNWYLVSEQAYSNVENGLQDFIKCMDDYGIANSEDEYKVCRDKYYNIVNSNIKSIDSQYVNTESNVESVSFTNGTMTANLVQPTFKPTYTIELDKNLVDLVKIIKVSGVPDIIECIGDQEYNEAGSKSVSAKIQNAGHNEAYFDFVIECDNEYMNGHADGLDFGPGETKTVNFQLAGGNPDENTNEGTCTLSVIDSNSRESSECNFNFDVKYKSGVSDCIGDETTCSPDKKTLFRCINDKWKLKVCKDGCELKDGKSYCIGEESNETTSKEACDKLIESNPSRYQWIEGVDYPWYKFWKKDVSGYCKDNYQIYFILGGIGGFILLIIIILILTKPKNGKKKKK